MPRLLVQPGNAPAAGAPRGAKRSCPDRSLDDLEATLQEGTADLPFVRASGALSKDALGLLGALRNTMNLLTQVRAGAGEGGTGSGR